MHVTLTTPFPVMAITLSAFAFIWLLYIWWAETKEIRSVLDGPEFFLAMAVRLLPDERRDWGSAMVTELNEFQSPSSRWQFALGCAWVALFPPHNRQSSVILAGILAVIAAVATGLTVNRVLPAGQVFAVTFVALVGMLATLMVARSRKPSSAAPGLLTSSTILFGIAGCIGTYIYIAIKYPSATHDPALVLSILFAIFLTIYLWLALIPPRGLITSFIATRIGTVTGLLDGLILGSGIIIIEASYNRDEGDPVLILLLVLVPIILVLISSTLAAGISRSFRAGVESALWAGLIIALAIFFELLLAPVLGFQIEAIIADKFAPGFEPDFAVWFPHWLGGELGGSITVLALVPGWLLFFGLIGGAIGKSLSFGELNQTRNSLS